MSIATTAALKHQDIRGEMMEVSRTGVVVPGGSAAELDCHDYSQEVLTL